MTGTEIFFDKLFQEYKKYEDDDDKDRLNEGIRRKAALASGMYPRTDPHYICYPTWEIFMSRLKKTRMDAIHSQAKPEKYKRGSIL